MEALRTKLMLEKAFKGHNADQLKSLLKDPEAQRFGVDLLVEAIKSEHIAFGEEWCFASVC